MRFAAEFFGAAIFVAAFGIGFSKMINHFLKEGKSNETSNRNNTRRR